jgi:hypothetical protein
MGAVFEAGGEIAVALALRPMLKALSGRHQSRVDAAAGPTAPPHAAEFHLVQQPPAHERIEGLLELFL